MKFTKRKIVISSSVIIGTILIFVAGLVTGASFIMDQNFNRNRANQALHAYEKISILMMLRRGEIKEAIDTLDRNAIYELWGSSRKTWRPGPRDMSQWPDLVIRYWREARAYYEKYPEVLQREIPANTSEVRRLLGEIPGLERKGIIRDFAKIYTGKTPPTLQISKWLGPAMTLEQLHGKVVLLDFWGVWCGPCLYWLPHTQQLHDKYNKMGLEVIGIHSYRKSETADEFLSENNYTFLVGIDTGDTAQNYAVTGWPTYYLIDKYGHLAWGPEHKPPSEEQIEPLLKD